MGIVILVHGFNSSFHDMSFLSDYFKNRGYLVYSPNLPTRFASFHKCTTIFEDCTNDYLNKCNYFNPKIHLVGHSMGGLIIRNYLARNTIDNIGRCVLIATPNKGTKLADLLCLYSPINKIHKPLDVLVTYKKLLYESNSSLELGIIAGTKSSWPFSLLLKNDNDGRVEVESTKMSNAKDFLLLPFGHKDIHHRTVTAQYIDNFLGTGRFHSI
ncbi:alpha/beta fold hydrolase [Natranaerobius trueperi]|uniref:Alpha/beta hydrolase n=1 Tax=Natranaerobius trueperi TaxID=759412 RepID=A0A226BX74_9FIRM|nr:alpha/beta fold hydrolase [Natranaerobius trueperi]OWZ82707.1 alpha/beta hydrolase [Natranaerobius trueperi]